MVFPDCMMPDGAEPCFAYQHERNRAVYWGRRALRAEAALRQIANGDGYYGAQAREYKEIAKIALRDLAITGADPDQQHGEIEAQFLALAQQMDCVKSLPGGLKFVTDLFMKIVESQGLTVVDSATVTDTAAVKPLTDQE